MRRATLAPFFLLVAYGLAFAAAALGTELLVFDDHPGQLYRVWHVVRHGFAPWAWNPGWWAGYPELQFYPPAFAWACALLHRASLGALSVAAAYQALVWVTYLAPGITVFWLLTRVLGNGWLALPGAFLALTWSSGVMSGVEGGVRWGMVAARLGWALIPLLLLALLRWAEEARRFPTAVTLLLVVIVLTHPAHLPTAIVIVVLAAYHGVGPRAARLRNAGIGLVLAAVMTAFWTVPLVLRLENVRPLAWGSLGDARLTPLGYMLIFAAVLLSVVMLVGKAGSRSGPSIGSKARADVIIASLPWIVTALVVTDALVLEPFGVRWLPANRLVDGAWLAVILAAGLGGGRLLARLPARATLALPIASLAVVAAVILLSLPGASLALWPRPGDWPKYDATVRGLRMAELWATLRALPDGRVLFVRSGVPLVYGVEWYRPHTHITALTPLASGRPIIHGTFTHPSPIAALVYRGSPAGGAITQLAEQLDGRVLFGQRLDQLDAATFHAHAARLGIAAVVALDEDVPLLRAFDEDPRLSRRLASPPFVVYVRREELSLPREAGAGRWQVLPGGGAGEWVSARIAYYPLWRAERNGAPIDSRRGASGELEVRRPPDGGAVDLRYSAGAAEHAGVAATIVALAIELIGVARRRASRSTPAGSPA